MSFSFDYKSFKIVAIATMVFYSINTQDSQEHIPLLLGGERSFVHAGERYPELLSR